MKGKILVTGGLGYIGSHTAVELINSGFEVVIVDDLSNSDISVRDRLEKLTGVKSPFYELDICNGEALDDVFVKEQGITGVIHFAASKAVGESVALPMKYYRNNLDGLMRVLEAMETHAVKALVFSSSCTVYGQPDKLPVDEQTPFQPAESPYGNTKQICEEILRDVSKTDTSLNTISLRYFNPVGAHETALIGELPKGTPNNLVPFITQVAAGIRPQLSVFGSDYNTSDGSAVRDYIHVVDLAKAHVIAVERLLSGQNKSKYEFFNIGTGHGYSVLEVLHKFEEVNDVKVNHQIVDRRPGDVEQIYADTTLANKELGWKAEKGLDEMMSSAWKWQQSL